MTETELSELRQSYWYYSFEIRPGDISNGRNHRNTLLTRELLRRVNVEETKCLDIGTMEGLIPTLMRRRGAKHVAAIDRCDYRKKNELVKSSFGVEWDYYPSTALHELQYKLSTSIPYETLVFSGVLYHMLDPLAGLVRVRALVHTGAIVIIETLAVANELITMFLNDEQSIYPYSTYFAPTLPCLEAFLRLVGLKPIDCVWFDEKTKSYLPLSGIAIACRAGSIPLLSKETVEPWLISISKTDFEELTSLKWLESESGDQIQYDHKSEQLVLSDTGGSVDLPRTRKTLSEFLIKPENISLKLSDMY